MCLCAGAPCFLAPNPRAEAGAGGSRRYHALTPDHAHHRSRGGRSGSHGSNRGSVAAARRPRCHWPPTWGPVCGPLESSPHGLVADWRALPTSCCECCWASSPRATRTTGSSVTRRMRGRATRSSGRPVRPAARRSGARQCARRCVKKPRGVRRATRRGCRPWTGPIAIHRAHSDRWHSSVVMHQRGRNDGQCGQTGPIWVEIKGHHPGAHADRYCCTIEPPTPGAQPDSSTARRQPHESG
jgi:hypothetical protein